MITVARPHASPHAYSDTRPHAHLPARSPARMPARGVISTFSWGGQIFFIFQCHRTIEKLEKTALYM